MIDSFLKYLRFERRYSPHTIQSYQNDLSQFQYFLAENFQGKLDQASHLEIRSWIISLIEKGIQPRSVNRKVASLRSVYRFLMRREVIEKDPVWKISALKSSKDLPHFVQENEMLKILDQFEFENDFEGWRDRAILEVLYGTGIRLAELLNLKDHDVDLKSGKLKVLGKRNKERIIPMPDALVPVIQQYINVRNMQVKSAKSSNLLVTEKGKPVYAMLVYRTVKKYLGLFTNSDKQSPHVLRHTFATHLLNKGAELNAVKDLLGHANLAATQVYTHNSLEKLKKTFDQAHPKA